MTFANVMKLKLQWLLSETREGFRFLSSVSLVQSHHQGGPQNQGMPATKDSLYFILRGLGLPLTGESGPQLGTWGIRGGTPDTGRLLSNIRKTLLISTQTEGY